MLGPLGGPADGKEAAFAAAVADMELWHCRTGHRQHSGLIKLGELDVGIPAGLVKPAGKCETCDVSKHEKR